MPGKEDFNSLISGCSPLRRKRTDQKWIEIWLVAKIVHGTEDVHEIISFPVRDVRDLSERYLIF